MGALAAWRTAEMALLLPIYLGLGVDSKEDSQLGCFGGLKEGLKDFWVPFVKQLLDFHYYRV